MPADKLPVPREEADHIVNNRKVATAYQSVGLGYAKLSGSKNPDKPYVYLTAMDNRAMQKNALHLIKGRMPKNDHEILLSRHMMTNAAIKRTPHISTVLCAALAACTLSP